MPKAAGSKRAGSAIKITASLAEDLSPLPGTHIESSQWLKEIQHLQSQWAPVRVCTYPPPNPHPVLGKQPTAGRSIGLQNWERLVLV